MHEKHGGAILFALWLVLIFAPRVLLAAAGDAPIKRSVTSFSYTTNDPKSSFGVPLVQVQLDERVTATFVIDTGTNTSLISDTLAGKLRLKPTPFQPLGRPFLLNGRPARSVSVAHLNIGNLHIGNQTLLVTDAGMLSSLWRHSVDGVIGVNILAAFSVFFDFPHRHIVIWYPGGFSADDLAKSAFKDAAATPLKLITGTGTFSTSVELQNGPLTASVDLTVDTGAGLTSIPDGIAEQLKLRPFQEYISTSSHGVVKMSKARVSLFQLGTWLLDHQQLTYPSQENTQFPSSLGMDVLSSRYVLLDFPQSKMYVLAP